MELLFKREQTSGRLSRFNFKLWGKFEVSGDEQALIDRYDLDESVLRRKGTWRSGSCNRSST
ncbi:hypothetical protein SAMN05518801_1395 [Novosphingobium sp. CF614]|uniref:hypothetical protein n=1 Tax=Novosphingobium sp. CF614 TaxID=1884364 RepID=UPI0008F1D245|nr:hypothetical protein [Novosphingobium sp. CF614]SFG51670.1 hypothetical protein SAMN05518801_1395 [Novosphingobium sp. CF614]